MRRFLISRPHRRRTPRPPAEPGFAPDGPPLHTVDVSLWSLMELALLLLAPGALCLIALRRLLGV